MYIYMYVHPAAACGPCSARLQPTRSETLRPPTRARSPLEDSRLFGPSPWKIFATTYEQKRLLSNPAPGENILSGNLAMETGCRAPENQFRKT